MERRLGVAEFLKALGSSPAEQAGGAENEAPDYELVLATVALKTGGHHVGV